MPARVANTYICEIAKNPVTLALFFLFFLVVAAPYSAWIA
jgi:hypothetical protein